MGRKLVGRTARKQLPLAPTAHTTTFTATSHRADDDAEALASGKGTYLNHTNTTRTPNGVVDLLAADNNNDPTPNSNTYEDDEDTISVLPPTRLFSSEEFAENKGTDDDTSSQGSDDQCIYARLGSFEERMEKELQDLEQFGVSAGEGGDTEAETLSSGSSSNNDIKSTQMKTKAQDPDGKGQRSPPKTIFAKASSVASSARSFASLPFKKGKGKSGKNLAMLSGKTNKIMSDYQAYLAEIQNEFPLSDDDDDDEIDYASDPALVNIHQVRESIRDSYLDQQSAASEEGCYDEEEGQSISPAAVVERHDSYATGGGEPLYRVWAREGGADAGYASVFGEDLSRPMIRGKRKCSGDYALPCLRSRKVKRGIVSLVALAAIATLISIGVATSHVKEHDESLPDQKGELNTVEIEVKDDAILASVAIDEDEHIAEIAKEEEQKKVPGKVVLNDFLSQGHKISEHEDNVDGWEGEYTAVLQEDEKEEWANGLKMFLDHKILTGTPLALPSHDITNDISNLYKDATLRYHPVMYDRSKGWKGQSYIEALVFCEEETGLALCPYDAICPNGANSEPLGGFREIPHGGEWAWVPVLDGANEWVQSGVRETCTRYSDMHGGEYPEWGVTGNGNEEVTQNVMCCTMA
mmetsp:Transcript_6791/g.12770  ORF Transcript_6791/g.12770 Transcript_6791/m.12770 type:complete len:638 (-) Transcript_6791:169-2082(-)|eukprot:CAMPEP_0201667832 /NCGR_PEP_ID=MMETSP0494-20130426/16917_1 /ASSEMBLY_ACC=CAM_ASM_000839 /TAXON_ID=420259 /ORGANISM="Thalassiosira gravida, Strain GMp14c1" /LENGTH=637 /DNA_ID=CAMNT_0048147985 /DNA_START=88 /DNA_END=2001 /DNA_ORIENTATION=+